MQLNHWQRIGIILSILWTLSLTNCANRPLTAEQQSENARMVETQKKAILEADREQCREFGFKKDTDAFSSCMMQIAQARSRAQEKQRESIPTSDDVSRSILMNATGGGQYVSPEDVAAHRMNPNVPLPSSSPAPPVHTSCYNFGGTIQCDTQ